MEKSLELVYQKSRKAIHSVSEKEGYPASDKFIIESFPDKEPPDGCMGNDFVSIACNRRLREVLSICTATDTYVVLKLQEFGAVRYGSLVQE